MANSLGPKQSFIRKWSKTPYPGQDVTWGRDDVFDMTAVLIKGGSHKNAEKLLVDMGVDSALGSEYSEGFSLHANPKMTKEGHTFGIIWWDGKLLSVLVHEIVHLVAGRFDGAGISFSIQNEETVAYYIEYWYRIFTKEPYGSK